MNKHRTEPKNLTIALTGAPPVRIETDRWPVIASARQDLIDHCRILVARRHEDCRVIVYGQEYWGGSSDPEYFGPEAGELLLPGTNSMEQQAQLIATKIVEVGETLNFPDRFIQQCIASMAPEELD